MAIADFGSLVDGAVLGRASADRAARVVNHGGLIGKHTRISAMQLTRRQWRLSKLAPDAANSVGNDPRIQRRPAYRRHAMTTLLKRFANDDSGATAIEYGLIAAGISVAIITVVNTLGSQLKSTFTNISSQLATAGK
jgi:pilus assembly protein Flp/PilA